MTRARHLATTSFVKRFGRSAVAAWCIGIGLATVAGAADSVWSMPQFVAKKAEWERILEVPLRLEGRVSTVGRGQLRFTKCDLAIHLSDEQSRQVPSGKNAEVTGTLVRDKDTGRLVFHAVQVKVLPGDLDQYRDREAALRNPKAEDWFTLAEWARERGRFYDDDELLAAARLCNVRGLGLEARNLPRDDVDGRFQLAVKARQIGVPDAIGDELRHEAYRAWWTRATAGGTTNAEELAALLRRLQSDWPNALSPLTAWPTDLLEAYTQNPLEAYRLADEAQRYVLQRIFAGTVQLRQITASAAADGSNGHEVAARIETQVPERRSLAEQFRDQELRYRKSQIGGASKAEAIELANVFRQRRNEDQAVDTLRRWLAARTQKLGKLAGAPEHLALADDYWALLKDEATAVTHLEAARRLEPESPDVAARYRELGYELDGGRWIKPLPQQSGTRPAGVTTLDVGLTAAEVRQIQGLPTRVATVVSGSSVDEYWTYGEPGTSRLVVQFSRRLHQGEPRVVRIFQR